MENTDPAAINQLSQPIGAEFELSTAQMNNVANFAKHVADMNRSTPAESRLSGINTVMESAAKGLEQRAGQGEDVTLEELAFAATVLGGIDDLAMENKLVEYIKSRMSPEEADLFRGKADELRNIKRATTPEQPGYTDMIMERSLGVSKFADSLKGAGRASSMLRFASQMMFAGSLRDKPAQQRILDGVANTFVKAK